MARYYVVRRYDGRMNAVAKPDPATLIAAGRRALEVEARALMALSPRLDAAFARACALALQCRGRVIVTGLGKSGHIGCKIAATLASTGTPSFFMHAAEASHGDIGMITREDVVLALSNSGETAEVLTLIPHLSRLGIAIIAMTGNAKSNLARAATIHLDVSVAEEACPLNLAPTASTTAMLALGDAFAVALLEARGFTPQDFARSHPGGTLGRKLLLHVADVMRTGDALPVVSPETTLGQGLVEMSKKGLGMCVIVEGAVDAGRMLGVFTDGDLRRALDGEADVRRTTMREIMNSPGKSVVSTVLAAEAANLMEKYRITALPVVDESGALVGALNVHDLLRAGVL
ncbi:MAG: KpsF/GutQ family sugar-phosphate isomerase [Steroidobacteraceae bacterium]|nr:KpsF/GutQ family sugar-phosphate isomerase [Steroidobacteraceae bacterium]